MVTPAVATELKKAKAHLTAAQTALGQITEQDPPTMTRVSLATNEVLAASRSIDLIARLENLNLLPSKGLTP